MGDLVIGPPRTIKRLFGSHEESADGAQQAANGGKDPQAAQAESPSQPDAAVTQSSADAKGAAAHTCPHCKAPMADDQEWCTQCGEREDGSLRARTGWYSAGVLTAASAILASGAAAAGVAALTQTPAKEGPHTPLATATATTAAAPPATASAPANPGSPETLKAPRSVPVSPPVKPPTPHATATPSASHASSTGGSTPSTESSTRTSATSTQSSGPEVAELQGLTASAYTLNPLYPKAALEGPENDPSRALEGRESGTAWSIPIKPGTAENLNVGLQIALGGPTQVGSVELHTSTPGFPLEIYGTTSRQPPTSIGAWTRLGLTPALKASATLKVGETNKHFRFVLLWIHKVPGDMKHVALGEVALFPPS
jgi:hypothetical protein